MTQWPPTRNELFELLERMLLIRRAEERIGEAAALGNIPGGVHLSIGQEATAVGICSQLEENDWITGTHRSHGHYLAKGGDVSRLFAEIWGKQSGICLGMGGEMHVADLSKGILGANGIVGGGIAIATGAALAAQLDGEHRVAVCFFGDGAANQGVFMESLNVSTVWKLPVVFVCENNLVSEFTVSSKVTAGALADRARAFNMPCAVVDGNDILAVADAARVAVNRGRLGAGPSYIETRTYRLRGHAGTEEIETYLMGHPYRTQEEVDEWKSASREPIARFRTYLTSHELADDRELDAIDTQVRHQIDRAIAFAEAGELADPELAFRLSASARQ